MYFFSNSEVYLKHALLQQESRSINEALSKYKQSTFSCYVLPKLFLFLYFIYTSFLEVCLNHTSFGLQGSDV